eukprot:TRINITY_DN595_c0_g1_i2.p1 TRINITY_DN595_c0_g1~~TRINITY_DN595_c0_g1_i2.p1  ORF type:complete len:772 (+),score=135.13 TRINITY_DN595_c0_g1_i2:319-2634(+)
MSLESLDDIAPTGDQQDEVLDSLLFSSAQKEFETVFRRFDRDGRGLISKPEALYALRRMLDAVRRQLDPDDVEPEPAPADDDDCWWRRCLRVARPDSRRAWTMVVDDSHAAECTLRQFCAAAWAAHDPHGDAQCIVDHLLAEEAEHGPLACESVAVSERFEVCVRIEEAATLRLPPQVSMTACTATTVSSVLFRLASQAGLDMVGNNVAVAHGSVYSLHLEFGGTVVLLDGDKTLLDCGIPTEGLLVLCSRTGEKLTLQIEIANYQELRCPRTVSVTFGVEQTAAQALHLVARKPSVRLAPSRESDFCLLRLGEPLQEDRSLASCGLKSGDVLSMRRQQSLEVVLTVIIEDFERLRCARKTTMAFQRTSTVKAMIEKVVRKNCVAIDAPPDRFVLSTLHTSIELEPTDTLQSIALMGNDTLVLRWKKEATAGSTLGAQQEADRMDNSDPEPRSLEDVQELRLTCRGLFGAVYSGTVGNRTVSVKELCTPIDLDDSPTWHHHVTEVHRDAKISRSLRCDNVLRVLAMFEGRRTVVTVSEFCEHGTLQEVLEFDDEPIGWDRLFSLATQLAQGIRYLHDLQPNALVHGNISSSNVLVTSDWTVKLYSFGCSRFADEVESPQRSIPAVVPWQAPEVLSGDSATVKSDVYSIGIILWELVTTCITGEYDWPFNEFRVRWEHELGALVSGLPKFRPTISSSYPPAFAALMRQCWQPEPWLRPTCHVVCEALDELQKTYKLEPFRWDERCFGCHLKSTGTEHRLPHQMHAWRHRVPF